MDQFESKQEILKDQVIELVKKFIKTHGGFTHADLIKLFGGPPFSEVGAALADLNMSFF